VQWLLVVSVRASRLALSVAAAGVLLTACSSAGSDARPAPATSPASAPATAPSEPVHAGTTVLFTGDFENGDFSQWTRCQARIYSGPCADMIQDFYGMQVVDEGARQGRYAARFELRDGDRPSWGGGERAEVARYKEGMVHEGDERWYEFSLRFDPDFPAETSKYLMVMQWHGADDLPPPMALEVQGDGRLVLTGHLPNAPSMVIGDIARGQWVDYVIHAKFSADGKKGWAEVHRNGVRAVPRHRRANMNSGHDYLKMGLYRDGHAKSTAVMWADGMRVTAP
jgi:hypothetical protein